MNILGIDSGSTAVKLIEIDLGNKIIHKLILKKMPILAALEIFINKEKVKMENISQIVLTGVGADEIQENIKGVPTKKVDEFIAIGTGGLALANKRSGIVVSIGTGTAFVEAKNKTFKHLGGTGVGGGALVNLCKKFGNIDTFEDINKAILKGNLKHVDLTIQDVATKEISGLPKDTTSANFGKLDSRAKMEDLIIGFANMIFETIGVMAVFVAQSRKTKNIIITGNVATMPYIKTVLNKIEKLHKGVKFIIPKNAEYATVIGAVKIAM